MAFLTIFLCLVFGTIGSCEVTKTNQWPNRSVIVQLFEWKWLDIAEECERFLGPKGYGGVQTSPASENLIIHLNDGQRPWYERYQVISYKLKTRSGDANDFLNMTTRCNRVGVRIYVDVVFNHMTGDHEANAGTAGSTANFSTFSYPAVPYKKKHFHHPVCDINNYDNATEVRDCQLVGLKDLNQTMPLVRQKIVEYLNKLINLGVAGFRVDAAKHMWPEDLKPIYDSLNNLNIQHGFDQNARPYIYQEVAHGGAVKPSDYKDIGDVTEFFVVSEMFNVFNGHKPLKNLKSWGSPSLGMLPSENALVFVDNHDTQRNTGGLNYKTARNYKVATAFLLAHSYGQPRIMSSYHFDRNDQGPPNDRNEDIQPPLINEDGSCEGGWVCEHRWPSIYKMVNFRNAVRDTKVENWWDNGNNQIAFSRGIKGFIVFNTEGKKLDRIFQTGLPSGKYCDIISGQRQGQICSGTTINVSNTGLASIKLSGIGDELHLAIHIGEEVGQMSRTVGLAQMVCERSRYSDLGRAKGLKRSQDFTEVLGGFESVFPIPN
ncbi:alpha-amylase 2-like isoform X2 [Trichoplusia ni]|nr:alpha-amylase 2-like isoform X2 [Trichoplusia ni]XP_026735021.1 alpha-amylase 2-like isoform X2 [Trichoplusia ni]XP_026735022.1 alpha-amylase 2-like isoform X2 [Trichoplusia ni]XP_026735023.1 alpha-amylase 2-like isoform X2 [Trichoplusia ni]